MWKREEKDCKSQKIWEFAGKPSSSNVRCSTHKVLPMRLPKHEPNRDKSRYVKVDGRKPRRPQHYIHKELQAPKE